MISRGERTFEIIGRWLRDVDELEAQGSRGKTRDFLSSGPINTGTAGFAQFVLRLHQPMPAPTPVRDR